MATGDLANAILEKIGVEDRVLGLLENDNSIPDADSDRVQLYNRGDNLEARMPSGETFLLVHNTSGLNLPGGLVQAISIITSTTSVAAATAGTSETVLGTLSTLPANLIEAGTQIRTKLMMRRTQTNGGPTVTVRLRVGGLSGTLLAQSAALAAGIGGNTGSALLIDALLTCRTGGASGNLFPHVLAFGATGATNLATSILTPSGSGLVMLSSPVSGIDWTASQDLVLTAQWSAGTSGNEIFLDAGHVEMCK
jgi:hypothetical protein